MDTYEVTGTTSYSMIVEANDEELAEEKWFENLDNSFLDWEFEFKEVNEKDL